MFLRCTTDPLLCSALPSWPFCAGSGRNSTRGAAYLPARPSSTAAGAQRPTDAATSAHRRPRHDRAPNNAAAARLQASPRASLPGRGASSWGWPVMRPLHATDTMA